MNLRYVNGQLGLLGGMLSLVLAVFAGISGVWQVRGEPGESKAALAFLLAAGAAAAAAAALRLLSRDARAQMGRREALLLVALTWLAGAALAGLPYLFWAHLAGAPRGHPFLRVVDCYFESMSGLTTTGASVLGSRFPIEDVPGSLLLWRSFTQWVGGLGIVVLFVAVLPSLGMGGKRLLQVEAPGHSAEGLQPQVRQAARVLVYIYLVISAAELAALLAAGMGWFDALCHTFSTIATGGFSPRNASIGAYDSTTIHCIILLFMILSGMNFSLFSALARRKFASVWRDPELRTYLVVVGAAAAIVSISLALAGAPIVTTTGATVDGSIWESIRHGVFTAASLCTTTGFCTADYNAWPFAAQGALVLTMFIGASSGSTSGGIKAIRVWVAFKVMISEVEHAFRPQVVRPVRVGNSVIDSEQKLDTVLFMLGMVLLFVGGAGAVMLLEAWLNPAHDCDFSTAATASVACLGTIGPGLSKVGAVGDYGWMTPYSKVVLSLLMALGRLEIFAIIVLFNSRFWRGE
jgi:trk system potassium uptake protein TrkH